MSFDYVPVKQQKRRQTLYANCPLLLYFLANTALLIDVTLIFLYLFCRYETVTETFKSVLFPQQ